MSHPENFIPWEQIEPLVRSGMTGDDLSCALAQRMGLDPDAYRIRCLNVAATLSEALRGGVLVEKRSAPVPAAHVASEHETIS